MFEKHSFENLFILDQTFNKKKNCNINLRVLKMFKEHFVSFFILTPHARATVAVTSHR